MNACCKPWAPVNPVSFLIGVKNSATNQRFSGIPDSHLRKGLVSIRIYICEIQPVVAGVVFYFDMWYIVVYTITDVCSEKYKCGWYTYEGKHIIEEKPDTSVFRTAVYLAVYKAFLFLHA